jgi:hypothetical protein
MTSRRKLRDELHNLPPEFELGASSADLMRRGRRIKMTRQGAAVAAVVVVVAGIGTTAAQLGNHRAGTHPISTAASNARFAPPLLASGGSGSPVPVSAVPSPVASPTSTAVDSSPGVAASALPSPVASAPGEIFPTPTPSLSPTAPSTADASCSPAPQSTVGAPPASDGANAVPWGSLIKVGADGPNKDVVIYAFHIEDAQLPCDKVAFMLGTDSPAGQVSGVTGEVAANEFSGSDLAPGFHATSESGGGNQISDWYIFGYYVGDATSVSIPEKSSPLPSSPAVVVPWSVNPDVKIWWISGTGAVPSTGTPIATDAQGNVLPAGNASPPSVG